MLECPRRTAARIPRMAGLAGVTLLLASCAPGAPAGGTPTHTRTPADSGPASSTAQSPEAGIPAHETPGPATSDRGLPIYGPGQVLELGGGEGEPVISVTVTSLTVQDTCPVDGGRPEHGAFALVEVEASFADDADAVRRPLDLSPEAWSFYATDGSRYDGELGTTSAASCQQAGNALPAELTPGSSVRGTLVLDIPEPEGALTLADVGTDIAEWPLP